MPRLTDRIAKLEAVASVGDVRFAWRETGETAAVAEARYCRDHPEAAAQPVTVIGWLGDREAWIAEPAQGTA